MGSETGTCCEKSCHGEIRTLLCRQHSILRAGVCGLGAPKHIGLCWRVCNNCSLKILITFSFSFSHLFSRFYCVSVCGSSKFVVGICASCHYKSSLQSIVSCCHLLLP